MIAIYITLGALGGVAATLALIVLYASSGRFAQLVSKQIEKRISELPDPALDAIEKFATEYQRAMSDYSDALRGQRERTAALATRITAIEREDESTVRGKQAIARFGNALEVHEGRLSRLEDSYRQLNQALFPRDRSSSVEGIDQRLRQLEAWRTRCDPQ